MTHPLQLTPEVDRHSLGHSNSDQNRDRIRFEFRDRRSLPIFRYSRSEPIIPGALIVLAMTLGHSSMGRVVNRKNNTEITKRFCGGPTGLAVGDTLALAANAGKHDSRRTLAVDDPRGSRS